MRSVSFSACLRAGCVEERPFAVQLQEGRGGCQLDGSSSLIVGFFGSVLVPSSAYTCATMLGAHNHDEYNTQAARPGQAIAFMQFEYGVCDSRALDFYYVPERDEYDVYYAGGDGRVVGSCYFNRGSSKYCPVPYFSSVL